MTTKTAAAKKTSIAAKPAKKAKRSAGEGTQSEKGVPKAKFPRHSLLKAMRIPEAIFDQNAGKACARAEAASFFGLSSPVGPFAVEIGSGVKFGLLDQPESGKIQPTALARKILRPQNPDDKIDGYREAILKAPDISEVYQHYRGENLPDDQFFRNTVVESYGVPAELFLEFKEVFLDSLETAELLSRHDGKVRVIDATSSAGKENDLFKQLERTTEIDANASCFVMQPFGAPLGSYYEKVYKPAIEKAGLKAVRADADIFATGKIMDQVWRGISSAKVLVAELTSRNPNVFYELGIAHALRKPVVLVSAKEEDVPFDLQHIRVIYYDTSDPFWGSKLIEKVSENILSAIKNPEEAVFRGELDLRSS